MLKKFLLSVSLVFCLLYNYGDCKPLNLNEIIDATCKVTSGVGAGSGTVFSEDENYYFVLTNYHVVGTNKNVDLEFYARGWKSNKLGAEVVWKAYQQNTDVDFCVVRVPKKKFGNKRPRVIPLVPRNHKMKPGNYISAAGCPQGIGPSAWEGHVRVSENNRIVFIPAPVGGQSGSGILTLIQNENGELESRIGAIVTWRIEQPLGQDSVVGGGIMISNLYDAFENGSKKANPIPTSYKHVSTPNCIHCGKSLYDHALATDGKFYCVNTTRETGNKYIVGLPRNENIKYWSANNTEIINLYETQCGPNGNCQPGQGGPTMPYYGDPDGLFRRRQPQPQPQQPPNGGGGGNPYGIEPPDIPGLGGNIPSTPKVEDKPIPKTPEELQPVPKDNALAEQLRDVANKMQSLAVEKENLEKLNKELQDKLADANIPITTKVSQVVQNNPTSSVVGFGLAGILLYFLWKRVIKNIVVKQVDKVEDLLQKKITEKWGEDAGKQARETMDGLDTLLLDWADTFLEERRYANKINKNIERSIFENQRSKAMEQLFKDSKPDISTLKEKLEDLLQSSKATEVAEKDISGTALIDKLITDLKGMPSPTTEQYEAIVKAVKDHESKENDTGVLAKIKDLENQIAQIKESKVEVK
jgi:hypothetical protein